MADPAEAGQAGKGARRRCGSDRGCQLGVIADGNRHQQQVGREVTVQVGPGSVGRACCRGHVGDLRLDRLVAGQAGRAVEEIGCAAAGAAAQQDVVQPVQVDVTRRSDEPVERRAAAEGDVGRHAGGPTVAASVDDPWLRSIAETEVWQRVAVDIAQRGDLGAHRCAAVGSHRGAGRRGWRHRAEVERDDAPVAQRVCRIADREVIVAVAVDVADAGSRGAGARQGVASECHGCQISGRIPTGGLAGQQIGLARAAGIQSADEYVVEAVAVHVAGRSRVRAEDQVVGRGQNQPVADVFVVQRQRAAVGGGLAKDQEDALVGRVADQHVAQSVAVDVAGGRDDAADACIRRADVAAGAVTQRRGVRYHGPTAARAVDDDDLAGAVVGCRQADGQVSAAVAVDISQPGDRHGIVNQRRWRLQPDRGAVVGIQSAAGQRFRSRRQRDIHDVVAVALQRKGGDVAQHVGQVGKHVARR